MSVSSHFEPQSYQAAPFQHWREAMDTELHAMESNHIWAIIPLPPGKHSIGCKWLYKIKYKADGSSKRYNARLVATCYNQQEGIDFIDTFSPVVKLATVEVLLALTSSCNWHLIQLDVNNAFLNQDLFEEVYMDLPLG